MTVKKTPKPSTKPAKATKQKTPAARERSKRAVAAKPRAATSTLSDEPWSPPRTREEAAATDTYLAHCSGCEAPDLGFFARPEPPEPPFEPGDEPSLAGGTRRGGAADGDEAASPGGGVPGDLPWPRRPRARPPPG